VIVACRCQETKRSGVVRELPRVGVTEDGEVQVVRDDTGDVHVYAKSSDDVLVHRKKTDSSKVASFDFLSCTLYFCPYRPKRLLVKLSLEGIEATSKSLNATQSNQ